MNLQNSSLNIVFIGRYNPDEVLSGPEKTAKRIFGEHSKKYKASFIQYYFDGNKYGIWKKLFGKEILQINDNAKLYTLGIFKVYSVLKKIRPRVIHIITFERFAVIALVYKLFNKVKIIYSAHGIIAYENSVIKNVPFLYKLKDKVCEKLFMNKSGKIIFTSESSIDIAEQYFIVDESKSVILSNGIDEGFHNKQHESKSGPIKAVFIYKNKFSESGLQLLNKILFKFAGKIELFIISNEKVNIDFSNVHYLKPMTSQELAAFYKDKDVFLSLNDYDTFSISTAEAMAAGLIPVVTIQTGISRYIENGFNGFTSDYNETEKLVENINKILNMNQGERETISRNAAKIFESLSWTSVYETYHNIYLQMVK